MPGYRHTTPLSGKAPIQPSQDTIGKSKDGVPRLELGEDHFSPESLVPPGGMSWGNCCFCGIYVGQRELCACASAPQRGPCGS